MSNWFDTLMLLGLVLLFTWYASRRLARVHQDIVGHGVYK